jgi:hypothetical protein
VARANPQTRCPGRTCAPARPRPGLGSGATTTERARPWRKAKRSTNRWWAARTGRGRHRRSSTNASGSGASLPLTFAGARHAAACQSSTGPCPIGHSECLGAASTPSSRVAVCSGMAGAMRNTDSVRVVPQAKGYRSPGRCASPTVFLRVLCAARRTIWAHRSNLSVRSGAQSRHQRRGSADRCGASPVRQ